MVLVVCADNYVHHQEVITTTVTQYAVFVLSTTKSHHTITLDFLYCIVKLCVSSKHHKDMYKQQGVPHNPVHGPVHSP